MLLPDTQKNASDQRAFAWRYAVEVGIPGALVSLVLITLKRVRTPQEFFSLITLVQGVLLVPSAMVLCYLGGLILWRLKRGLGPF
jgi:hypothetical protein